MYAKQKPPADALMALIKSGENLSSRAVASQVLWAAVSLTSVFEMGTGGASLRESPEWVESVAGGPSWGAGRSAAVLSKLHIEN